MYFLLLEIFYFFNYINIQDFLGQESEQKNIINSGGQVSYNYLNNYSRFCLQIYRLL